MNWNRGDEENVFTLPPAAEFDALELWAERTYTPEVGEPRVFKLCISRFNLVTITPPAETKLDDTGAEVSVAAPSYKDFDSPLVDLRDGVVKFLQKNWPALSPVTPGAADTNWTRIAIVLLKGTKKKGVRTVVETREIV